MGSPQEKRRPFARIQSRMFDDCFLFLWLLLIRSFKRLRIFCVFAHMAFSSLEGCVPFVISDTRKLLSTSYCSVFRRLFSTYRRFRRGRRRFSTFSRVRSGRTLLPTRDLLRRGRISRPP